MPQCRSWKVKSCADSGGACWQKVLSFRISLSLVVDVPAPKLYKNWFYNFLLEGPAICFSQIVVFHFVFVVLSEISNAHFSLISELIHSVSLFVKVKASIKTINVFCNDL